MLPSRAQIGNLFSEFFVIYKPRDIVSGDFFWLSSSDRFKLIAAVDCTGHGVPGAFMSILGGVLLNQIVNFNDTWAPGTILTQLHLLIVQTLRHNNSDVRDGMDAAVCCYDVLENKFSFAGARNGLIYLQNNELHELKADRFSIGGTLATERFFNEHQISMISSGDFSFYIASDGFQDQFGGTEKKKFSSKKLKENIFELRTLPMHKQGEMLEIIFDIWMVQGDERQIDDVLIIGAKI
jgi:serine phosphatase RsbU (regulator of sigma subunit)